MLYTKGIFMKTYFAPLDVLRFFAAFWVMSFHYFLGYSGDLHWYRYGNLGVQLFFIISGFVIVQSMKGKSLSEFAVGRFIRLFPLFWILCTITYLITLIVPHADPVSFTEYLISMTMLGDKFGSVFGYTRLVDAAYWTLSVELIFYAGIAAFTYLFSYKHLRYFFLAWFGIAVAAFAVHHDQDFILKLLLVRHASYFVFGGMLALIALKEAKTYIQKYFDWVLLVASAAYATYIHPLALPPYFTPNPSDVHIITILNIIFFAGVGLLVYISPRLTDKKMLSRFAIIGGLTYPLYLLHQTIGNTLIKYVTDRYDILWAPAAFVFEFIIIAIAYFVYTKDKSMRSWLRTKLEASRSSDVVVL
jgi:peptidoglycan/LPS O-acetylase OafA/YrhL